MMQGTRESKPFAAAAGGLRIGPEKEKGLLAAARKNLPSPKEMVAHYESQGMQPQEASLKVIDDLQNLLFRVITTNNKTKKTSNLDALNSRLLRLESKLDSKPGYPQTLAIGITSGAVFHVLPQLASSVAHIWTSMDSWLGNRKRILVLNREDMITKADRNAWADYYGRQGIKVVFFNGQLGMVRAGIVGYPNVGKSSLINHLLKRRMCPAAPRPGVTQALKWVRFGSDLELLDSPGIIPMRISDQSSAIKLAICDDIGERSYDFTDVAAILVQMLSKLPTSNKNVLLDRYKIDTDGRCGKTFVHKLAIQLFNGDNHQAAF